MIRLFRKIRNQLLSEDKYTTYLLYASGEIILVMIGILLALQVNNWNEHRKETNAGEELASKLLKELMITYEYSKVVYEAYNTQINYIDLVLSQGENLNIDSLLSISVEEYQFVRLFTFPIYILSFTEHFAPNLHVFESSRSDGTIKLVQDEELVSVFKYIYIDTKNKIKIFDDREIISNESIEDYITGKYGYLLEGPSNIKNGLLDDETTKELMKVLITDGSLRFKLQLKNNILKRKRAHLQHRIIPTIEAVLANH